MHKFVLHFLLTITFCLTGFSQANAQHPYKFRWQRGDVLQYRVQHKTSVIETVGNSSAKASSNLQLIKQWKVVAVDKQGVATIQYSLSWMRHEQKFPDGKTWFFDSKQLEKSTPSLKGLSKMVGVPIAVLQVAPSGEVLSAVKGSVERYQAEPPFHIVFSKTPVKVGGTWERKNTVRTGARGDGDKYEAVQTYTFQKKNELATFGLTTTFPKVPENPFDRIPLFQKQPQGTVVFNTKAGRVERATLNISKQLANHQGEGSRYEFRSEYTETYVGK